MSKTQLTLREVRKHVLGLSQTAFAAELGVSRRTLCRYEKVGAPTMALRLATRLMNDRLKRPPPPAAP